MIGIQNPSSTDKDWNPVLGIRNPWLGIQNPKTVLDFPYVPDFLFISHLFAPSANIITRLPYVKATQGNSEVKKRLHNEFLFRRG